MGYGFGPAVISYHYSDVRDVACVKELWVTALDLQSYHIIMVTCVKRRVKELWV